MAEKRKTSKILVNPPKFGTNYDTSPPYFCFFSMRPEIIYFSYDGWQGTGKLDTVNLETLEFDSGGKIKAWIFQKIKVAIMASTFSMNVVHKEENGREIEIPIPPNFFPGEQQLRSRVKIYVRVWTDNGSLNGEPGILTLRGKGNTQAINNILRLAQIALVKKVQMKYSPQFTLSHFKIPLKAALDSTKITSRTANKSRAIYTPELDITSSEPLDYLMDETEMKDSMYEWGLAQTWLRGQEAYKMSVLHENAAKIGYTSEKMIDAALPQYNPPESDPAYDTFYDDSFPSAPVPGYNDY